MKLSRTLLSGVVALAFASPVLAQFNPNVTTSSDIFHLTSDGPYAIGGIKYGTYHGQLLQSPGMPIIDVWCDDFSNHFAQDKAVNLTRFDAGQVAFDSRTRFGFNNLDNYKKAAYLTQFFATTTVTTDVQALHYAIWHLLTPGAPSGPPVAGAAAEAAWLSKLDNGLWAELNTKYWFVMSPTNMQGKLGVFPKLRGSQEMIVMVAPEPSAVLLVSTGLLGIVGLARVRRRSNKK
jgi:hypothetical protein